MHQNGQFNERAEKHQDAYRIVLKEAVKINECYGTDDQTAS